MIYIPVLIASTGSNLDAVMAGKIPEISPIIAAKLVPRNTLLILNTNSKSIAFVNTTDIIQTKSSQTAPPITERITASNKN